MWQSPWTQPESFILLTLIVTAGLDREPELLQLLFACLSSLNRHLVRQLAPDLPAALQRTARLRHHRAEHVRALAAQSTAFLFRHAPASALRAGVRTAFAGARPHGCELLSHIHGCIERTSLGSKVDIKNHNLPVPLSWRAMQGCIVGLQACQKECFKPVTNNFPFCLYLPQLSLDLHELVTAQWKPPYA